MSEIVWRGVPDAATWDAVFDACDWAGFFQSRRWIEAWRRADPSLAPAAHAVALRDGTRAVLPACRLPLARGLLGRRVMPAGTFSGWIADRPPSDAALRSLAAELRRLGDCDLRLSPYAPGMADVEASGDVTWAVDLAPGFDAVVRGFSKGHRSAASKAFREGVEIEPARGREDWADYLAVYADTLARWGSRAQGRHPRALFDALAETSDARVTLWLARHEGRVVAGALCLAAARHVAYWHGAARAEAFPLRPVHALLHEAMRAACARGARWFDMNPCGGLEGVARFKRGFGARALPFAHLRRTSWRVRMADRTGRLWRSARGRIVDGAGSALRLG